MGQKVNPISNRLGIIRGWDSNWFGGKNYGDTLLEDSKIRKYLDVRLNKASVSRIVIERTLKLVTITICTARPGMIIGKGGEEVDKLKEELKKITAKDVQINIYEVKRPELDAQIVASNIARQIEGKIAYRRAVKMAVASTMRMGAQGIKVLVSGRLNGAEMARNEMFKEGRTPLHAARRHRLCTCAGTHQGGPHRSEGLDLPRRGLWQARPGSQLRQQQQQPRRWPRWRASRRTRWRTSQQQPLIKHTLNTLLDS